jgi:hypothetical protein
MRELDLGVAWLRVRQYWIWQWINELTPWMKVIPCQIQIIRKGFWMAKPMSQSAH